MASRWWPLCAVEGMHLRDGYDVLVGDDARGLRRRGRARVRRRGLWNGCRAMGWATSPGISRWTRHARWCGKVLLATRELVSRSAPARLRTRAAIPRVPVPPDPPARPRAAACAANSTSPAPRRSPPPAIQRRGQALAGIVQLASRFPSSPRVVGRRGRDGARLPRNSASKHALRRWQEARGGAPARRPSGASAQRRAQLS